MTGAARRRLQIALTLAALAGLVAYLAAHRDELAGVPALAARHWLIVAATTVAGTLASTRGVQRLLAALGARLPFGEMFALHNAAYLLNLLPMKAGAVLRATYLKHRHGFGYSRFGLFALYATLLALFAATATGLAALLSAYGLGDPSRRLLAALLVAGAGGTAAALALPLPRPPRRWPRVAAVVADLAASRREALRAPRGVLAAALWLVVNYLLGALRLAAIYHGLGIEAGVAAFLLLGAVAQLSSLVNVTPAALGIREAFLAAGTVGIGAPPEIGVLAGLVERAVGLLWAFAVGLPAAVWIGRRHPLGVAAAPEP